MRHNNAVNIVIQSEYAPCEQESLGNIEEQSRSNVFDFEHLI